MEDAGISVLNCSVQVIERCFRAIFNKVRFVELLVDVFRWSILRDSENRSQGLVLNDLGYLPVVGAI